MTGRLPRWRATVTYRTDHGPNPVVHDIEELDELHNLVERGPDWNTITSIHVELAEPGEPDFTVERAAQQ